MKKNKKRKQKKARNMVVVGMILTTKSQKFHHKCEPRGGSQNSQKEFLKEME